MANKKTNIIAKDKNGKDLNFLIIFMKKKIVITGGTGRFGKY